MKTLLKILKNKYVIVILVFLVFIVIIDDTSLMMSFRLRRQLKDMENTKEYYMNEISKDSAKIQALQHDPKAIEQFAREEYLMKKDNEDIFLVKTQLDEDE